MIANQKLLNDQMANQTDQQKTGSAVSGSVPDVKTNYPDVSIKELIARSNSALYRCTEGGDHKKDKEGF